MRRASISRRLHVLVKMLPASRRPAVRAIRRDRGSVPRPRRRADSSHAGRGAVRPTPCHGPRWGAIIARRVTDEGPGGTARARGTAGQDGVAACRWAMSAALTFCRSVL